MSYEPRKIDPDDGVRWRRRTGVAQRVHENDGERAPANTLRPEAETLARGFYDGKSAACAALARPTIYRNAGQPGPFLAHMIESLDVFYAKQLDGKEGWRHSASRFDMPAV
ncbi:hypothetical protein [Variovorax sp. LT1R16]|uniref:hypothetical protein n=1 Tax=Variovorax sp. LT1R16 TaxID=3443728 RepID=UPI003F4732E1